MQARSVSLLTTADRIELFVRGERCATYRYADGQPPGCVSLAAPGERWITQSNADGLGMWLMPPIQFPSTLNSQPSTLDLTARRGSYSVGFQHACAWLDAEDKLVLTDTRTIRVVPGPSDGAILDVTLRLQPAEDRTITFAPSKRGLLCLRVASALYDADANALGGGQIRNNWGEYGMAALHGRQAHWCAGMGVVRGETIGFAFLEHPNNPFFPSPWVAQADGVLSPSPFGWRSLMLAPGESLDLRYRLLIFMGYVNQGWADARLQEFARE